VMISHNLHDIFEVADRIAVLRLGQMVNVFERKNSSQQDIVHAMTAGRLKSVPGMAVE
jgi:D-xylose transport system ATP-binding protein